MVLSRSQKRDAFCGPFNGALPQSRNGPSGRIGFWANCGHEPKALPFAIVAPSLGFNEVCKEFCALTISVIFGVLLPILYSRPNWRRFSAKSLSGSMYICSALFNAWMMRRGFEALCGRTRDGSLSSTRLGLAIGGRRDSLLNRVFQPAVRAGVGVRRLRCRWCGGVAGGEPVAG